jgi:hypothetical protein
MVCGIFYNVPFRFPCSNNNKEIVLSSTPMHIYSAPISHDGTLLVNNYSHIHTSPPTSPTHRPQSITPTTTPYALNQTVL